MAYKRYQPTQFKKKWYPKNTPRSSGPRIRKVCDWSKYQSNIFKEIENGSGHLLVSAVPGSGKTTTIIEALYHCPPECRTISLAFNKSIQIELENRVPELVETKTLHGLGFSILRQSLGKLNVDNDKTYHAIVGLHGEDEKTADLRENLRKCVSLCKGYLAETNNEIEDVIDCHGIETGIDSERVKFITDTQTILQLATTQNRMIDFDDMLFLPHRLNLSAPTYDRIFVDETQDLNKAQVELLMKMVDSESRMTFVGDRYQAIYGFRGAMSDAIDKIIERTNAKTMPLSVSYRCARRIVELAKEVQPDIQAAPNAPDGIVENVSKEKLILDAAPGDFIVSRTNAPLIPLCLQFIKEGRKANIQGRDLGKSLSYMIKKSGADNVASFLSWLENWKGQEVERLSSKNKDYTYVLDRYECMLAFSEGTFSLGEIKANIEKMFDDTDGKGKILLSTCHRIKGKEADKVWLLRPTFKPQRNQEESNIYYVGITRAKSHLCLVESI